MMDIYIYTNADENHDLDISRDGGGYDTHLR